VRSLIPILATAGAAAAFSVASAAAEPVPAAAARAQDTLKERLSDKASDEQRVDDCKVPKEKRGAKKRPDCRQPASKEPAK
jgi:hypothetical protein